MLDEKAPLEIFEEIDSTIVEARRRAEFGDTGPVWLMARRQTAGRGRRGRAWASIEGNLFATYLGRTAKPPAQIALLGFAAGIAIAETIEALIGERRVSLKWPNDVMLDGAKAGGIMLDSGALDAAAPARHWFALAFGVNIAGAPRDIDQPTQALGALMRGAAPPAPEELLGAIRSRLEVWARRLDAEGFGALRTAWLARAHGLGRAARVGIGDDRIEGVLSGLSEHGELELETADGLRRISAGDVHFPELSAV
jgi:BirA family biotin operon repressor/biotin-[acetyl-CoA-carboxylase] ligase